MRKHLALLLTISSGVPLLASNARALDATPAVVNDPSGTLIIHQGIPCDKSIDQTTTVEHGRIELTPSTGVDVPGGKAFAMTRATLSFTPFTISGSCLGFGETRQYTEIGVRLIKSIFFTAASVGGDVYSVTIPKENVEVLQAATFNGEMESGLRQPSEDVTGTIDLASRTIQLHVVLATRVHFDGHGCVPGTDHCIVPPQDRDGTLTADIAGVLTLPDVDGDGVADKDDNCRFTPNADQTPVPTPVVTPPPSVTLTSCLDRDIGAASAVDVCDRTAVSITNNAPAAFHAGLNVVTWTGVDGKGRIGTATQNVTIADATPPTVSCTAVSPQGNSFIVQGDDICGEPVLRLGSYVLHGGEQIKIEETGKDGVRFIDVVGGGFRHFHVGKGQAIVTATDSSGNRAMAVCR